MKKLHTFMTPSSINSTLLFSSSSSSFLHCGGPENGLLICPAGRILIDSGTQMVPLWMYQSWWPHALLQAVPDNGWAPQGYYSGPPMQDRGLIWWETSAWGSANSFAKTVSELCCSLRLFLPSPPPFLFSFAGVWPTLWSEGSPCLLPLPTLYPSQAFAQ